MGPIEQKPPPSELSHRGAKLAPRIISPWQRPRATRALSGAGSGVTEPGVPFN